MVADTIEKVITSCITLLNIPAFDKFFIFQFDNAAFKSIAKFGLNSDESKVYFCLHGIRVVGIDKSDKGCFVYGVKRQITLDEKWIETATAKTCLQHPQDECYKSAEVIIS